MLEPLRTCFVAAQWTAETPVFLGDHWGTPEEGRQMYQWSLEVQQQYQAMMDALKCRPGQDPLQKIDQLLNDLEVTTLKVEQLQQRLNSEVCPDDSRTSDQ